jgi:hypothetical protein
VVPVSGWYVAGSTVTLSATAPTAGSGEQYVWNGWTGTGTGSYSGTGNNSALVTMNGPIAETASWTHQYQLTVTSAYGSPSGQGWYTAGSQATFGVTTPVSGGTGVQYVFAAWSGDSSSKSAINSILMNAPKTVTATWTTQYQVTYVASGNANPVSVPASEWVISGNAATEYFPAGATVGGVMDTFLSDNRPASITKPTTITGLYQTSYYLTVSSAHGSPIGQGWYNAGVTADAGLASGTVSGGAGTQYVFTSWSGDASGSAFSSSNAITMNGPKTATANWKTQYQVTFAVSGGGSASPTGSNVWENAGSLPITATPNSGYTFSSWSSNTGSITFANANSTSSTATISGTGTITASFAINTPTPTPTATPTLTSTPTLTPTPTLTVTPTPAVTLAPTSSQTPALAAMGQYLPVIAAAIILGAVIIGLVVHGRRPAKIIILS